MKDMNILYNPHPLSCKNVTLLVKTGHLCPIHAQCVKEEEILRQIPGICNLMCPHSDSHYIATSNYIIC